MDNTFCKIFPKLSRTIQNSFIYAETAETCSNLVILTKNSFFPKFFKTLQNNPKLAKIVEKNFKWAKTSETNRNLEIRAKTKFFKKFPKLSKTIQNLINSCYQAEIRHNLSKSRQKVQNSLPDPSFRAFCSKLKPVFDQNFFVGSGFLAPRSIRRGRLPQKSVISTFLRRGKKWILRLQSQSGCINEATNNSTASSSLANFKPSLSQTRKLL